MTARARTRHAAGQTPPMAFHVPGCPIPKARARVTQRGTFTPDKTRRAEAAIQSYWMAAGSKKFTGAVELRCAFLMPRPATHLRVDGQTLTATGTRSGEASADVDNLVKLVADGLNGFAWHDDRQVVQVHAVKRWAPTNDMAGTYVVAVAADDAARQSLVDVIVGACTKEAA